jgi:lia operon protein LiaG
MKKLLGMSLIIVGVGLFITTIINFFPFGYKTNEGKEFKSNLDSVNNIELSSTSVDWNIENYHGEELIVTLVNADNQVNIQSHQQGRTLKLEINEKRFRWLSFNFSGRSTVNVQLPMEYEDELNIRTVSGNIKAKKELNLGNLLMKSVSGDVNTNVIKASNINLSSTSGDIMVDQALAETMKFKTVSGDLSVKQVTGEVNGETVSGDITIRFYKENKQTKLKTVSGDIKLEIPIGNAIFNLQTLSGDILTTPGFTDKLGEGLYNINIQTVSGDIKISE